MSQQAEPRVLVVDDEPNIVDVVTMALRFQGFEVDSAATGGEALAAVERLVCEDWLRRDIEATLEAADASLLDRLVEGSRVHAVRRVEEMAAAVAMLEELGVEPRVARAAGEWLTELAATTR